MNFHSVVCSSGVVPSSSTYTYTYVTLYTFSRVTRSRRE